MKVLILTGAPGVGKTTLAKAWAKKHGGVIIPVDNLSNWVYNKNFPKWNEEAERFLAELAAKITAEYMLKDFPVVIDYVWTPKGIRIIKDRLDEVEGVSCRAVWLKCSLEENQRRDTLRIADHQMGERVEIVRAELEACEWDNEVLTLNSTELSIEEVLEKINRFMSAQ